jgi:A/G-specific adenine glycosylase
MEMNNNGFSAKILSWYDCHGRPLPWRLSKDPYKIWISEIMLQQTGVKAVIPRFQEFLRVFPTLESLAQGSIDQVLHLWQGLGYYRRAHQMHECAQKLLKQGGIFPPCAKALRLLPGIGPYTSAAIASIAFNKPVLALDGNLRRVFCRYFDIESDLDSLSLEPYGYSLLDKKRPGDFNEALMDLGSLICTPRKPLCSVCPVAQDCLAHKNGTAQQRPVKGKALVKKNLSTHMFVYQKGNQLWLERKESLAKKDLSQHVSLEICPEKGQKGTLLQGLWSLASSPWSGDRLSQEELQQLKQEARWIGEFYHVFTHIKLHVTLWQVQGFSKYFAGKSQGKWVSKESLMLGKKEHPKVKQSQSFYPTATLYRKALDLWEQRDGKDLFLV